MTCTTAYNDKGKQVLANLGCSCYINTAVQCMSHCIPFLHHILNHDCKGADFDVFKELRDLLVILWLDRKGVIPRRFVKAMRLSFDKLMNIDEQNDMQEFVNILIDKLNASIGQALGANDIARICNDLDDFNRRANTSWLSVHKAAYSWIVDMFYGQFVRQITCSHCKDVTHIFDTFSDVMISFDQEGCEDDAELGRMVSKLINRELIPDRECDSCKNHAPGECITRFYRLPQILMINVKRFSGNLTKVTKPINVPEHIDLSATCIDIKPDVKAKYSLMSIACHIGSMHNGHYFAVCRHPDGSWLMIDDDSLSPIEHYTKIDSRAYYTMFYVNSEHMKCTI